ncbi:CHS2 [Brettanomyces bruxellensis]|uniref:chitin synthase n=1 Tax=Dekkera bruxellensis TaxID=5007 RepID=A0A7D9H2C7_DEKBR|nr:CHS2 [Brettanomyces bruxellensis]
MSQPIKSPFDVDEYDSDNSQDATDNYEMSGWSHTNRRRPPPATSISPMSQNRSKAHSTIRQDALLSPPGATRRAPGTSRPFSGSNVVNSSYEYDLGEYFNGERDNEEEEKGTYDSKSFLDENYLGSNRSKSASMSQISAQSSALPLQQGGRESFPFQQFVRDADEPEIFGQEGFVAEEKRQLGQRQGGAATQPAYGSDPGFEPRGAPGGVPRGAPGVPSAQGSYLGSAAAYAQTGSNAALPNVAGAEQVKLLNGAYYSFDYPVPGPLLGKIPFPGARDLAEFKYVRYHAVTADPKDYKPENAEACRYIENFPLRNKWYAVPRETELMIVCTMYNEDEVLLARTLKGVFKNIKKMYKGEEPFGKDCWKKIVVVVVADGRNKLNERAKALLTLLGCYQEGVIQEKVNGKDVKAHLFEYTTSFGIGKFEYGSSRSADGKTQAQSTQKSTRSSHFSSSCPKIPLVTEQTIPVQLMFLLKEHNAQKINSHRWAFNFLCPNLRPKIVCLVDVGTEPGPESIFKLWEAFKDPKVAGACGEIRAMLGKHASANDETSFFGKGWRWLWTKCCDTAACIANPLVAAQNFEYKMSNILDKPTESFFGFVSVLPGAFSAYRYSALQGDPLQAYFHGEDMKTNTDKPAGVLESNMYLAEDRILCYQLVSKPASSCLLRYVHDSYAVTDVPGSISEFMGQRRRWLNGSFFAALYSLIHFYRIFHSGHTFGRKLLLIIETIYQFLSIVLSWFSLATYFLIFRILTLQVLGTSIGWKAGNVLAVAFLWIYIVASGLTFIISFGNKPKESRHLYQFVFFLYSLIAIYMMFCVVVLTISSILGIESDIKNSADPTNPLTYLKNATFRDLTVSLASTYALYLLSSLLFFDMFHLFACILQYLLLNPAYINVLTIYAFCNIDDISWGTKGANKPEGGSSEPKKVANVAKQKTGGSAAADEHVLLLSEALKDPDEMYREAQSELESSDDGGHHQSDSSIKISRKNYAKGRTYTVLLWLLSNFVLLVVVLRTGGLDDFISIQKEGYQSNNSGTTTTVSSRLFKRQYDQESATIFMTVILWIVAGMALYRFISCICYRIDFFARRRRYHRSQVYY